MLHNSSHGGKCEELEVTVRDLAAAVVDMHLTGNDFLTRCGLKSRRDIRIFAAQFVIAAQRAYRRCTQLSNVYVAPALSCATFEAHSPAHHPALFRPQTRRELHKKPGQVDAAARVHEPRGARGGGYKPGSRGAAGAPALHPGEAGLGTAGSGRGGAGAGEVGGAALFRFHVGRVGAAAAEEG